MTHAGMHLVMDWQALATLAIVMAATAYLARRWWPGLQGLFKPAVQAAPSASATACGTVHAQSPSTSCNSGSGCGNCGHSATPAKDHRIQIVKRPAHTE